LRLTNSPGIPAREAQTRRWASQVDKYEISIQVGDTVYVCRYQSRSDEDLSWIQGKEAQVRIKGKTMYVKKVTGKEAEATILRTAKAPTP
jgi:hypothetical protein